MRRLSSFIALILLTAGLAGCIGADDDIDPTQDGNPTDAAPTYELPATITGMEPVTNIQHEGAAGLVIHDDLAYVAGLSDGFYILDVTDPKNPEKISQLGNFSARDVDTFTVDENLYVALAADSAGIHIVDVTNPLEPELLVEEFTIGEPFHNINIIPGTTILYNSRSLGSDQTNPGIDILELADPSNPEVATVYEFPPTAGEGPAPSPVATTGCHDIEVYPEEDRAYCAGVTQTYILDIADPLEPSIISTITNPAVNIHHWAIPSNDHDTLIIGDEFGGAAAPTTCLGHAQTPAGDASQPYGGLWFYDISDPTNPTPQGWISAPTHATEQVCTAHFGQVLPDKDQLVTGWYTAGVLLIDFADPTNPTLLDQWGQGETNVWDVQYHNGHLITGDIGHGSDILALTGE